MFELFRMWALLEGIGIFCFPLTLLVCHNLPDRGWAFSKSLGMLVLSFTIWLPLMYFNGLPFSQLFIWGISCILLACSLAGFIRTYRELLKMIRRNWLYIVLVEVLFLGMIFLLGSVRSFGPEIRSFEMFMDEGFIASIMRAPHLPPHDMWLSGYDINYYYYAHFTIAVLAKGIGQTPSIAFNTGICIFFGLCAINLFGIICNIVAWARFVRKQVDEDRAAPFVQPDTVYPALFAATPYGIIGCLMALLFGNLASTRQWWLTHDKPSTDLFTVWFSPSRVINAPTTINEFPAFSFLLSCFHAHVITLAFTVLAVGLIFNLLLEPQRQGLQLFGRGWQIPWTLFCTAMVIGGLFVMNGWDYPTYMALACLCIMVQQWQAHQRQFSWLLIWHILISTGCLILVSLLLYLPFYLDFISPSQGLGLVSPRMRSQLNEELLIYGLFVFVYITLLIASVLRVPLSNKVRVDPNLSKASSSDVPTKLGEQSETDEQFRSGWLQQRKLQFLLLPGTGLLYLLFCLLLLRFMPNSVTFVVSSSLAFSGFLLMLYHQRERSLAFVLCLGAIAFALVAFCEVIFLRDAFAGSDYERMNTVFKFYFQAWMLLSVACATGLFFILDEFLLLQLRVTWVIWLQRSIMGLWNVFLIALMLGGLIYPMTAPFARYAVMENGSTRPRLIQHNTLDGMDYLKNCNVPNCAFDTAADYNAILWINKHIEGDPVLVEAHGNSSLGDDYTYFSRISAFTGLPTILGWQGHEYQWRLTWLQRPGNFIELQRRASDVDLIYTSPDPAIVVSTMLHYHAQYLYVGRLEMERYPLANLQRFAAYMQAVYTTPGATIYKLKT